jgi:hypothetical protein
MLGRSPRRRELQFLPPGWRLHTSDKPHHLEFAIHNLDRKPRESPLQTESPLPEAAAGKDRLRAQAPGKTGGRYQKRRGGRNDGAQSPAIV